MEITATYPFDAPVDRVWALLMDTAVITECLPGCKELRPLGNDRYQAELVVAVAAVTGNYAATVAIEDKVPPTSYRLAVDGTGRAGFVKGLATITLAADGNRTIVNVAGKGQVGGAIARVGQRLLEGVGKMMMDRFFGCLSTKLKGSGVGG
jgi:uncharacterized protein